MQLVEAHARIWFVCIKLDRGGIKVRGVIKRLVLNKGFGFIEGDDKLERFFHKSACRPWVNFDALAEGDAITFEEDRSPKGPRAKHIDNAAGEIIDSTAKAIAPEFAPDPTPRAIPVGRRETETGRRTPAHHRSAPKGFRTRR